VVRDVQNSTSRAAAKRLGNKTTRDDLLQALLEKLDIGSMAKELGYLDRSLVQRCYVALGEYIYYAGYGRAASGLGP